MSGSGGDGLRRVGVSAERVAARLGMPPVSAQDALSELWPDCAGSLAAVSTLVGMRDDCIVVEVSDPAVREEFRWRSEQIITAVTCGLSARGLERNLPRSIQIRGVLVGRQPPA